MLGAIASHERRSRAQLASRTGLTKATVSSLVDTLIGARLVLEGDPDRGFVGRPGSPLRLDPDGPAGLGVEVNVDYFSVCVVDFTGVVRSMRVVAGDNRRRSVDAVLHRVTLAAEEALADVRDAGLVAAGLAVAVPGIVDIDGVLRRAPNLPGWEDVAVAERLRVLLDLPPGSVACDNEANLAAMAELWLAGEPKRRDFVHVSGEIGVGAGIVVDGRLWRGTRGLGGELGHVMVDPDGPVCSCGARGCLEQLAGQEALLRASGAPVKIVTALGAPDGSVRELYQRARTGDRRTIDALERAGAALGVALSALINLVDVPAVVLGGLYAELAPWLVDAVTRELRERVVSYRWSPTELAVSPLGASAAVKGAAATVVRAIVDDPAASFPEMLAAL